MKRRLTLLLALALPLPPATAADPPGMTITGDQELPQVLYVTPWRAPKRLDPPRPAPENPTRRPLSPCQLGADAPLVHWSCAPPPEAGSGKR